MAIRIAMNVICDRCLKPYEQKNLEYGEAVPEVERKKLIVLREGDPDPKTGEVSQEVVISYQDLCSQCDGVVEKAVARIKMDPAAAPPPKKGKRGKKRNGVRTTVKEETPEETPEEVPSEDVSENESAEDETPEDDTPESVAAPADPVPEDEPEDEDEHLF